MANMVICEDCGEEKEHYAKGLCSTCYKHQQHYSEGNTCLDCGTIITNEATRCKSCSNESLDRSRSHAGENNPNWRGGVVERNGRVFVYAPDNPMSDCRGYVRRSRLVLANKLGRNLTREEIVHHRDGNPANDNPDNLRLFENHAEHTRHHWRMRKAYGLLREFISQRQVAIDEARRFVLTSRLFLAMIESAKRARHSALQGLVFQNIIS